jgi:hypothetical protein
VTAWGGLLAPVPDGRGWYLAGYGLIDRDCPTKPWQ